MGAKSAPAHWKATKNTKKNGFFCPDDQHLKTRKRGTLKSEHTVERMHYHHSVYWATIWQGWVLLPCTQSPWDILEWDRVIWLKWFAWSTHCFIIFQHTISYQYEWEGHMATWFCMGSNILAITPPVLAGYLVTAIHLNGYDHLHTRIDACVDACVDVHVLKSYLEVLCSVWRIKFAPLISWFHIQLTS